MIFKKLKQRKHDKELRLLLGNLREIEIYSKYYTSLEELNENIEALERAKDVFRNRQLKKIPGVFSKSDIMLIGRQITSMDQTIVELKAAREELKLNSR